MVFGAGLRTSLRRGWSAGLPHLALASVAVSGAAYLQQIILARLLNPADFGVVRTVEATLVVLLMAGSLGTPTLAVRYAPELHAQRSGALLRQLLLLAFLGTTIVAIAVMAGTLLFGGGPIGATLRVIVWSIVFASGARVIYGFQQGRLDVRGIANVVIAVALVSITFTSLLAARYGLNGWVGGRLAGDAVLMAGSLWVVRKYLFGPPVTPTHANRDLVTFGAAITLSFALRAGVDACALIILNIKGVNPEQVGYFGLGTLVATAILVLPGAFGALVLPRMVKRQKSQSGPAYMWWAMKWSLVFTVPLCVLLVIAGPVLLRTVLPEYAPGALVIALLIALAPLRAAGAMAGNQLLAHSNVRATIAFNGVGAALVIGLGMFMVEQAGIAGAAIALLLAELVILALTTAAAVRQTTRAA
jgi:O-antigen/teichoic acid export membrane protein